jgi:Tfp pilus assembly protein PilO
MCAQHLRSPPASNTAYSQLGHNLFIMPKMFSEINKDLEVAQRKLTAASEPNQRRAVLPEMRKLLEQADELVQEMQRQLPPK